jgi:2-keto-4-pentenoate hydratase/2-oxohepta-3-ene-1,7-dioic acid hydratase in catechol pathway
VGEARDPKRFLVPGDEVTVEIEGIGLLTNPVVEEMFEDEPSKEEKKS